MSLKDHDDYHNREGKDQGHGDAQENSKQYLGGCGCLGGGTLCTCTQPIGVGSAEHALCIWTPF